MQITSGRVVDGRVELTAELPEGTEVTVLARDSEETFEADAELEAVLLESIAQGHAANAFRRRSCFAKCAAANEEAAARRVHALAAQNIREATQSITNAGYATDSLWVPMNIRFTSSVHVRLVNGPTRAANSIAR